MAIAINLENPEARKKLIQNIMGSENKGRRALSRRQVEIYNDDLHQHVWERIARRFSVDTAEQMPIISSINLCRRIVTQEASIYKNPPDRVFTDLSEAQEEDIRKIYDMMMTDAKMMQSNKSFRLQRQNHIMIVPQNGKLKLRVLRNHHVDKIDDNTDPEKAAGYIISTMNMDFLSENRRKDSRGSGFRGRYDTFIDQPSNTINELIGDPEDFKLSDMRFVVWTEEFNFIMDGNGNIISTDADGNPDILNPIPGFMPIIDISMEKDFTYWVQDGDPLGEFTMEYNTLMSDIHNIVMMQGYAQSYLIAKDELIPDKIQLGPNMIVKLPVEGPEDPRPEFGFANPNSDIGGAISFAETLLANFLTSRGIDPKTITGSTDGRKFSSGIERLLSMIESFEASKSDYDIYSNAEKNIFDVVKAWYNASVKNPDKFIDRKWIHGALSEDSEVEIKFSGPEMIQSDEDKVRIWNEKIEAGLASRIEAIMDMRNVEREEAEKILEQIKEDEDLGGMDANQQIGINQNSEAGFEGFDGSSKDESEEDSRGNFSRGNQ